jgi:prepilin-type N-terminal cleavage/methylation domain-containing protein
MSNIKRQRAKSKGQRAKEFIAFLSPITHCKKGFTLLEVLVALSVVSGVFLLVLTSFSYHIDIFSRKKDSLKLVLRAKENLYLYKTGKLIELEGARDGIEYEIKTEDTEYQLKKVTSTARSGKDEASLLVYMRK